MNPKIFITGASGYIGTSLVEAFIKASIGCSGSYLGHRPTPKPNFTASCADLYLKQVPEGVFKGIETVVHLAWDDRLFQNDKSPNIKLTKNLLKYLEIQDEPRVKRIIYLSFVGADKNSNSDFLKEKYECEHLILNSKIPSKVILRSSIVLSGNMESDRFIQFILKQLQYPLFYVVPKPTQEIFPINLADITQSIKNICMSPIVEGCQFAEIIGKTAISNEKIFEMVATRFLSNKKLAIKGGFLGEVGRKLVSARETKQTPKAKIAQTALTLNIKPSLDFSKNNELMNQIKLNEVNLENVLGLHKVTNKNNL